LGAHNLGFWQATVVVGPEIRARAPSAIAQRAEALLEAVLELVTKNALAELGGVAGAAAIALCGFGKLYLRPRRPAVADRPRKGGGSKTSDASAWRPAD
jgi:hypothetical protein